MIFFLSSVMADTRPDMGIGMLFFLFFGKSKFSCVVPSLTRYVCNSPASLTRAKRVAAAENV